MRPALIFAGLLFTWISSGFAQRVIEIDLTNQRVYLLDRGRVILNSPISSGRFGHETPTGMFRVTDKDVDHASSFYGFFGNPLTKQIVVPDADVDMRIPAGLEFVKAPMRYYVQFHPAIGLHAGFLPGYPASHGCVRLPEQYALALFQSVGIGTPVRVYGRPQGGRPYWASPSNRAARPVRVAAFGWRGTRGPYNAELHRNREAAFNRFDAEWDAKEKFLDHEIDALEQRIDHAAGLAKGSLRLDLEGLNQAKDEFEIRRDAAKELLKRRWGDD